MLGSFMLVLEQYLITNVQQVTLRLQATMSQSSDYQTKEV